MLKEEPKTFEQIRAVLSGAGFNVAIANAKKNGWIKIEKNNSDSLVSIKEKPIETQLTSVVEEIVPLSEKSYEEKIIEVEKQINNEIQRHQPEDLEYDTEDTQEEVIEVLPKEELKEKKVNISAKDALNIRNEEIRIQKLSKQNKIDNQGYQGLTIHPKVLRYKNNRK